MNFSNNVNKQALIVSIGAASLVGYIVYSSYSSTMKTISEVKNVEVSWLGELIKNYTYLESNVDTESTKNNK
tara:strand:- start:1770 stop:1985 length:216 start_codon:yes stop_codon:yes gene_type:complete